MKFNKNPNAFAWVNTSSPFFLFYNCNSSIWFIQKRTSHTDTKQIFFKIISLKCERKGFAHSKVQKKLLSKEKKNLQETFASNDRLTMRAAHKHNLLYIGDQSNIASLCKFTYEIVVYLCNVWVYIAVISAIQWCMYNKNFAEFPTSWYFFFWFCGLQRYFVGKHTSQTLDHTRSLIYFFFLVSFSIANRRITRALWWWSLLLVLFLLIFFSKKFSMPIYAVQCFTCNGWVSVWKQILENHVLRHSGCRILWFFLN